MAPLKRWRKGLFYLNVPSMSRCVDVALRTRTNDEVITIELKLENWRRALRQARDHLLAADRAYVCLPGIRISEDCIREVRESGIGLLAVDTKGPGYQVREVVTAPKSKY